LIEKPLSGKSRLNMRPKIVHIITRLDMGGSAQNTLQSCRLLGGEFEMVLVHGRSRESAMSASERAAVRRGMEAARRVGVRFVCLTSLVRDIAPLRDAQALLALWRLLRRERPALVHTHTSKAGILGRLAARAAGVRHVVHTPHGHVFYGHFGPLRSRLFLGLERIFSHLTERLVALTDGERQDYIRLSVCPPQKLRRIHSGVKLRRYRPPDLGAVDEKRMLGILPTAPVVGFIGWLLPVKGPMHLLQAMQMVWPHHPEAVLVYVGRGDLEVNLRATALDMGLDGRVKFLGWRDDVPDILAAFDMLVLPSLNEGMGRVLVEAMAAAKPVVASDTGGIPELVRPGENGLLVPPGDATALAGAIRRLLDDPEAARRMGERGQAISRRYSLEAMGARLKSLYRECLAADAGN